MFGGGSVKYPCSIKNLSLTVDELSKYDGSSAKYPLLVSCKCIIYDVGEGKEFYAPGRRYGWMAGRDVTVALAKFSSDRKYINCTWGSLSDSEADLLNKWEQWLQAKDTEEKPAQPARLALHKYATRS
ncbi:Membrane steroid-binding protein 1 [Cymbomonas tetramitiformis]|uniref:Membrane steroid-binding protein 1 n=1 Tax=Cymbomonas tetramitiformis TaxID=36881 RepID=A0AAE0C9K2_9CHLO|nr:Membrane steroid-binding protein 1 [Cymbomonas tetramitiformis]